MQPRARRPRGNRVLVISGAVALLCLLVQTLILPETENIFCAAIVALSSVATFGYCAQHGLIRRLPLSTVAVIGFNLTTESIALVAQTVDLKPLTFNLQSPTATFTAIFAAQLVVLAAHGVYARLPALQRPGRLLAARVLVPLRFFRMPSAGELWIIGGIGMTATFLSRVVYGNDIDYGDSFGKYLQSLTFFIVFPYFIPFRSLYLLRPVRPAPRSMLGLIPYSGLVLFVAIALGKRVAFAFTGFAILASILLMLGMGRAKISSRSKLWLAVALIVAIPASTMVADLSTAIQMTRDTSGQTGLADQVSATSAAYADKPALARYRADLEGTGKSNYIGYSETYIGNEFLQRLTYTKYTDLTITASQRFSGAEQSLLREDFKTSVIALLPTPVLRLLGIPIDKRDREFSTGDLYQNLAYNTRLGGAVTGSSITNARDIFGSVWPLAIFCLYLFVFCILDSMSVRTRVGTVISPVAFSLLFSLASHSLVTDSVAQTIGLATREYLSNLLSFLVLSIFARIAMSVFTGRVATARPRPVQRLA